MYKNQMVNVKNFILSDKLFIFFVQFVSLIISRNILLIQTTNHLARIHPFIKLFICYKAKFKRCFTQS